MHTNLHSKMKENQNQLKICYENVLPYVFPNEIRTAPENRIPNTNSHSVPRYLERQQPKMLMYVIRNLKWNHSIFLNGGFVSQKVLKFYRIFCLSCGEIIASGQSNRYCARNRNLPYGGRWCPIQRSKRNPTSCPKCGFR